MKIKVAMDGFEVKIPRQYENQYYDICKQWETLTKLELEFVDYQKMIISDVNNYISIDTKGKTKVKGKYEFKDIPLHKNKSHSIIPLAVYEYWVNNIPVEQTIRNHKNIFDFCAGVRAKKSEKGGQSRYELHYVKDGDIHIDKLSKTVRYFISNKGKTLFKKYESGDSEHVEAPLRKGKMFREWKVTYFNKAYYPDSFQDYDINYDYYIIKAKDWINDIQKDITQLNLF